MLSPNRDTVLAWTEGGHIARENLPAALRTAGVQATPMAWASFLDTLFLWLGCIFLAVAVIFFFAWNWQDMSRLTKLGLAQVPIVLALAAAWRLGLERAAGKAVLFAASLLVGALLALVGQIYQTGADTYELFAVWSLAILPWTLLARMPALWLFELLLANVAIALYFNTFPGIFGLLFSTARLLWVLLAFNTLAWVVWEVIAWRAAQRPHWALRCLAFASSALVTMLAAQYVFEVRVQGLWGVLVWSIWMALAYFTFRRRIPDLFVLACGVFSGIVVVTSILVEVLMKSARSDPAAFLFIGTTVIGMSAAGGWWLRQVAKEQGA